MLRCRCLHGSVGFQGGAAGLLLPPQLRGQRGHAAAGRLWCMAAASVWQSASQEYPLHVNGVGLCVWHVGVTFVDFVGVYVLLLMLAGSCVGGPPQPPGTFVGGVGRACCLVGTLTDDVGCCFQGAAVTVVDANLCTYLCAGVLRGVQGYCRSWEGDWGSIL